MVIFTSSSKLASLSLKSVAFEASTVKIFCVPTPLENVSPLDSRVTSWGAAAAPFAFPGKRSTCARDTRPPSEFPAAPPLPPTSEHTSPLRFASCNQLNKILGECIEAGAAVQRHGELPGGFGGCNIRQNSDIGGGHAVALRIFHQVHGFIGEMQQAFLGSRIHGVGCHAHTGRQLDVQALIHEPGTLSD